MPAAVLSCSFAKRPCVRPRAERCPQRSRPAHALKGPARGLCAGTRNLRALSDKKQHDIHPNISMCERLNGLIALKILAHSLRRASSLLIIHRCHTMWKWSSWTFQMQSTCTLKLPSTPAASARKRFCCTINQKLCRCGEIFELRVTRNSTIFTRLFRCAND